MGKEPEHHELSDHEVLLRLFDHAKGFVQKSGLHVLLVVLVLTIAVVLYRTHVLRKQAVAYGTWALLGQLDDPSFLFLQPSDQAEGIRTADLKLVDEAMASPGDSRARPWLLLKRGSLLASGGRWNDALAAYKQVADGNPKLAPVADGATAAALEGAGRYADAATLCERLAPGSAARWVDAGRCREFAGNLDTAKANYGRALEAADLDEMLRSFATARLAALAQGEALPPPPPPKPAAPLTPLMVPAETPAVPADTAVQPAPTPAPAAETSGATE